ncbi:MAG: hypothetical protein GXO30_08680 [Epsilonproteobacteria bacterium]|nr:hypothetical protein [Campylobacterota bacterium]
MPTTQITIKPNNHQIYQCQNDKKLELLNKIIDENKDLDIVVACSKDVQHIKDAMKTQSVIILEDKELVKDKELGCELMISYDLPIKAIVYIARIIKATKKAIFLVDVSEQKGLHDIEMLLGRAIKQNVISGFEYEVIEKKETNGFNPKKMTKEQIKEEAKKRYDKVTAEPKEKSTRVKKDYEKDLKKKEFKDSPKKWDKPKKVGRKINIKARKDK